MTYITEMCRPFMSVLSLFTIVTKMPEKSNLRKVCLGSRRVEAEGEGG